MDKLGLAATLAVTMSALVPAAAAAQMRAEVRKRDLDLAKPADVRRLDRRIAVAAAHVCDADYVTDAGRRLASRACRADAAQSAAAQRDRLIAHAPTAVAAR